MALTGLAIAAALALAKDQMIDKPKEARQRKLAAATQRLSPWTGLSAQPVSESNTLGTMMQYGATGAAMGSEYSKGTAPKSTETMSAMNPYSSAPATGAASGYNYNQDPNAFWSNPRGQ